MLELRAPGKRGESLPARPGATYSGRVSTFNRELGEAPFKTLPEEANEHLYRLVADWQILSDLSQADLLLWLQNRYDGFSCAAHCRPATGPTVHLDDVIGLTLPATRQALMEQVMLHGEVLENPVRRWTGMNTVSEILVPIPFKGEVIGVVAIEANLAFQVGEIGGEGWFKPVARQLRLMMAQGKFPYEQTPTVGNHGNPRVADGALLLDESGVVEHASPNALSAFKRLGYTGSLVGNDLAQSVIPLVVSDEVADETLAVVLAGVGSWVTEIEVRGVSMTIRSLPLMREGKRTGALLLCRDVTEKRSREKELLSKDATIREVHHRVKNNLQTVSALLRLQARRSSDETVKEALAQAERRISIIATVHEALSHTVDETVSFDETFGNLLTLVATAASEDHFVETIFSGSFGTLGADAASALGVVLTELVTNAVEHGLPQRNGRVLVHADRSPEELVVTVTDDGVGADVEAIGDGLGTQIVQTLVKTELGGAVQWERRKPPETGTIVRLTATRL